MRRDHSEFEGERQGQVAVVVEVVEGWRGRDNWVSEAEVEEGWGRLGCCWVGEGGAEAEEEEE